ncbi:MAG: YggU family protein [Gammaproteobacteria bacterium]|nr:MAG: YggU family protein [Gammaproteobacteria bacterium]
MSDFFSWHDSDLILNCHIQANAKSTEIIGLHGNAVKIRIAALPSQGKANVALVTHLATEFGVRKNQVSLLSGHTNKRKRFKIDQPQKIPSPLSTLIKIK